MYGESLMGAAQLNGPLVVSVVKSQSWYGSWSVAQYGQP